MKNSAYDRAVDTLRKSSIELQKSPELKHIVDSRDKVMARFQPIFSENHLSQLTEEEFTAFLLFKNNCHWPLHRSSSEICADMSLLRSSLSDLLDEEQPIEVRFDKASKAVPGMGKAVISAILQVSAPEKYGVWNNTSEKGLKSLNLWPRFDRSESMGGRYLKINQILSSLSHELQIDLWSLDALWWHVQGPHDVKPLIFRIQSILERKGQVILYGPPGTGKTYWAENAANELAAQSNFQKRFDQLSDHQRSSITGDGKSFGVVRTCCFHPAYGYEDFIEGYRPEQADGKMSFVLRDGIFKKLCKNALSNPGAKFYLIIDEINRGDIPRIFGELMTIIEKDKRGKSIILPTSGEQFKVPSNVYIIGTMNTADRSIALLDAALRRRFGFIELMPDPSILGGATVMGINLARWLEALNLRICEYVGKDARNLQIGHSYLLKDDGTPIADFSEFARALYEEIIPLLEEYCYEDYSTLEKILGAGIVDANDQKIRHELFRIPGHEELLQVLGTISNETSEE